MVMRQARDQKAGIIEVVDGRRDGLKNDLAGDLPDRTGTGVGLFE